jgi:hypothetical protein
LKEACGFRLLRTFPFGFGWGVILSGAKDLLFESPCTTSTSSPAGAGICTSEYLVILTAASHKQKLVTGFSSRYDIDRLVYYEMYGNVLRAIAREKELKGWLRKKKIVLIE